MENCELCSSSNVRIKHALQHFNIIECKVCGLLWQSPLPSNDDLKFIYNDTSYWSQPYFSNCGTNYKRDEKIQMYEQVLKKLDYLFPERGSLLDVGCGTGVFLDIANKTGWNTIGVECSETASNYASKNFNLRIMCESINDVSFPKNEFNVITMWDVIEHLLSPKQVLLKLLHSLKPGGLMVIFTPRSNSMVRETSPLLDLLISRQPKPFLETVYSPLHTYYFNIMNLQNFFNAHGVTTLETIQMPMSPDRAGHGTLLQRLILNGIDELGAVANKSYRFILLGQKHQEG